MAQVTLLPGDYVLTEGMTEEQYHAVARAFMNAGAAAGEYPNEPYFHIFDCIGWTKERNTLWHQSTKYFMTPGAWRSLTVNQVLNATNAGNEWGHEDSITKSYLALKNTPATGDGTMKMTSAEKGWVAKLQAVLDECPSNRMAAYTIGDPYVKLYDSSKEEQINAGTGDFCQCVEAVDAELASIKFPFQVHSTAG